MAGSREVKDAPGADINFRRALRRASPDVSDLEVRQMRLAALESAID